MSPMLIIIVMMMTGHLSQAEDVGEEVIMAVATIEVAAIIVAEVAVAAADVVVVAEVAAVEEAEGISAEVIITKGTKLPRNTVFEYLNYYNG